jgi:hypothetical protein
MSTTATMSQIERPEFAPELESLFRRYSRFVYKTAFVITGSPEDALFVHSPSPATRS